ncbi:GntR family transcriptional regulator [Demequina soli]|uniref:GntR family transcriptional regulator n=1 Tax=Demequina soli TaxID=1638987 RepID=UPI000783195C|nr:GntR family transcriptional regulator [Demequina soli]
MAADPRVLDELRAAILRGEFAPRQRLVESDLCEAFDASRFAIRAALQALEADGLVERQRNVGARIREISLEEACEITEVRQVVEGLIARRAAERVSDEEATGLEAIGRQMHDAVAAGELALYSDLNARLHSSLRDIARHEKASGIIAQLHGQMVRHQFALSRVPGRSKVSVHQHQAIIDAVVGRDPDGAEAAMRAHIGSVIEALRGIG